MKYLIFLLTLWSSHFTVAQQQKQDSLLYLLSSTAEDTVKANLLADLGQFYEYHSNPDSALLMYHRGLELAKTLNSEKVEMKLQKLLAWYSWRLGDFSTAIRLGYGLLDYSKSKNDTLQIVNSYGLLANSYRDQGDYEEALSVMFESSPFAINPKGIECFNCGVATAAIGAIYFGLQKYDSALFYLEKSLAYPKDFAHGWILLMTGRTWAKLNNNAEAIDYFRQSILELPEEYNYKDLAGAYTSIANLFLSEGIMDSAAYYGNLALEIAKERNFNKELLEAYLSLSATFETTNKDDALHYYKVAMGLKAEIYNQDNQRQIASYKFNEIIKQNELLAAEDDYMNRLKMNATLGSTFTMLIIAFFLFRNIRQKQKAKQKIELAYDQLIATQSQLIQSEKMASLGELTAGIAHEIQNPLNFVNNFSDVSKDLIDEMQEELTLGNPDVAREISEDVKQNLDKIHHHGQRASGIVKGMLEHSRTGDGVKEPTDINAMADEYLRLAYHGMRAKDKSFNADFKTDFDENLPKVNVVPQDIGRVLLNLINNAFYAVDKKAKEGIKDYQPIVEIRTKNHEESIEINVVDNGEGIPNQVRDKIFQPFFTTKPTGSGTGLGLSLSYDIVKSHGGEISVDGNSGIGTVFSVSIPLSS